MNEVTTYPELKALVSRITAHWPELGAYLQGTDGAMYRLVGYSSRNVTGRQRPALVMFVPANVAVSRIPDGTCSLR